MISQINTGLNVPASKQREQARLVKKSYMTHHPLLNAVNTVLTRSEELLMAYYNAEAAIVRCKPTAKAGEDWQEDYEEATKVLEAGHRVAERWLRGMSGTSPAEENGENDEQEQDSAVSVIFGFDVDSAALTLPDTLKLAESGVKRLTRALPMEADECGSIASL